MREPLKKDYQAELAVLAPPQVRPLWDNTPAGFAPYVTYAASTSDSMCYTADQLGVA